MVTRRLGSGGPEVSAIGLGCMGMSDFYGPADRDESIATIRAALDAGLTLLDTGDFYGSGHNELLIAEAIEGWSRDEIVLSVKFGPLRDPGGGWGGIDLRPAAIADALAYSLRRLGTDYIDIYRPARIDPAVPIEEVVGAMAGMVDKGWIRAIGLSEVSGETLRRAHPVHPIADVQIEYSLFSRGIEEALLDTARELGVGITAYGVLSRGLLSGHWTKAGAGERDFRAISPRFQPGNIDRNLKLVEALRGVAAGLGVSVAQIAIAWVLARGEDIVPLVGARTRDRLIEALGAFDIVLDEDALAAIGRAVPKDAAAGARYDAQGMTQLDGGG